MTCIVRVTSSKGKVRFVKTVPLAPHRADIRPVIDASDATRFSEDEAQDILAALEANEYLNLANGFTAEILDAVTHFPVSNGFDNHCQ